MKTNRSETLEINDANWDSWLAATGFLYPLTENQLDVFDQLYENYDFKLKHAHIDVNSIIGDEMHFSGGQVIPLFVNKAETAEFQSLRMAARKGDDDISVEIINKMRQHHKKDEE